MSKSRPSATYLASLKKRYWAGRKKERSLILDEFVKTTGYHRKHAIALLRGKREHRRGPIRRVGRRRYLQEDRMAVLQIAEWFDQISSKRLRAAMDNTLEELYRRKHLRVSRAVWHGCV